MSGESSSAAGWSSSLRPPLLPRFPPVRPDDPRLAESLCVWHGNPDEMTAGRPVLVGFPHDEGVRRNAGRLGASEAPTAIRLWLSRLTAFDPETQADLASLSLLDLGDVDTRLDLEDAQFALGQVVAELLRREAIPIVLGGGHETAYGHFLGYVGAGLEPSVINLDAHLDVRPTNASRGHSGSPFRQMMEHPGHPLAPCRYVCLGAQPSAVGREHLDLVLRRGGTVHWAGELEGKLVGALDALCQHRAPVYLSLDADVVRAGDVPGVSAPNPLGLSGSEVARAVRVAAACAGVTSFELVEINPRFDLDDRSTRWAAAVIWHFLAGLARRRQVTTEG